MHMQNASKFSENIVKVERIQNVTTKYHVEPKWSLKAAEVQSKIEMYMELIRIEFGRWGRLSRTK